MNPYLLCPQLLSFQKKKPMQQAMCLSGNLKKEMP